jgi:hypothetical protein
VSNYFDGDNADETIPEKPATVASEMQTSVQPRYIQVVEKWPVAMDVISVPDGLEMPRKVPVHPAMSRKVTSLSATSRRLTQNVPNLGPLPTQAQLQQAVTEEYDDAEAEGDTVGTPAANEEVDVKDGETLTYEDKHRKKHRDVEKIVHPVRRKREEGNPPEYHPPPPASQAPKIRVIPGGPYVPGALIGRRKSLRATMATGNPEKRMMDQCTSYTNFLVKAQGLIPPMGPKILQMMKATCDGPVREGVANSQYTLMCNSLGSAVEPFLVSPTTDWGGICKEVLRVFKEAGIGQL